LIGLFHPEIVTKDNIPMIIKNPILL
jgi:hypothetical protein